MNSKELNLNMAWSGTDQGTQLKEGGSSGFNAVMTGVGYASLMHKFLVHLL
jgi:hypothetical protein